MIKIFLRTLSKNNWNFYGCEGHSDEEQHEPTEEEIEEMLLENAEVIEEKGKSVLG